MDQENTFQLLFYFTRRRHCGSERAESNPCISVAYCTVYKSCTGYHAHTPTENARLFHTNTFWTSYRIHEVLAI